MYIGPWQEYQIASVFSKSAEERQQQISDFYQRWQHLCQEKGQERATEELLWGPLFAAAGAGVDSDTASAPPTSMGHRHRHWQLESNCDGGVELTTGRAQMLR